MKVGFITPKYEITLKVSAGGLILAPRSPPENLGGGVEPQRKKSLDLLDGDVIAPLKGISNDLLNVSQRII